MNPNGFQTQVNTVQAPGVAGDFASTNPFASVLGGPGALVAPAGGLVVGNFAWVGPNGQVSQSYVSGYQVGFLGRNQQGLITQFLEDATQVVPEGFMVTLFDEGDFWAFFADGATVGQNVYADPNTGAPISSASTPTLGTATASAGFSGTATLVNTSDVLTVAAVTHGIINVGDTVAGTDIPGATTILNQLTGTPGGVGTYTMSAAATATVGSAEAITTSSAFMLVTAVADGSLNFGDVFSGTDVAAGSSVGAQVPPFVGEATLNSTVDITITSVDGGTDLLRVGATITGDGIPASTTISSQTSGTPGGDGVYVISNAATITQAGVVISSGDSDGQTGLYSINPGAQIFGASSVPETITVAGTAQSTGFKVRGIQVAGNDIVAKISTI
jgi:hypothetical protein